MINVFTAPYLFDGEKIIEDGAIAFNGKILFVGNKENVLSHLNDAEYQLRNYANGFIMPGLVNSHLHFEVRQVMERYKRTSLSQMQMRHFVLREVLWFVCATASPQQGIWGIETMYSGT